MELVNDLLAFLDGAPSPWHAAALISEGLESEGFITGEWREVDGGFFESERGVLRCDGALVAWCWPNNSDPRAGSTIVGAHTDSPGLRLKPRPNSQAAGFSTLEIEIYGGVLLNSWIDRDLGIAGRVFAPDGTSRLFCDGRPIARIPQLAIHLDREVNERGLVLNRQTHVRPLWAVGPADVFVETMGLNHETISGFDALLFDTNPARLVGLNGELIASGRLDNLVSCWAAKRALVRHSGPRPMVICLFDHEEVGSQSTVGAAGPMLEVTLRELLRARGALDHWHRFTSSSLCISADNAHALHPNYPERHDPNHAPLINRGPALKFNTNQRYATSARGAAHVTMACQKANIPLQLFVSNNTMPCGSTIGPTTATRLGIETVDVGVPQLAMHSARETCGAVDPLTLVDLLVAVAASTAF